MSLLPHATGRRLLVATAVLVVCDIIGGFIAVATDLNTWSEAWLFDTKGTVPLPVATVQLALAWVATRSGRRRAQRVAAVLLSAFCVISLLAGLFDGDLIDSVSSDGLSPSVAWAVVLLALTALVGLLAAQQARQLREAA